MNRTRTGDDVRRVRRHLDAMGGFAFTSWWTLPLDARVLETEPSVDRLLDGSAFADAVQAMAGQLFDPVPAGMGRG